MGFDFPGAVFYQLRLDGREGAALFTEAAGGGSESAIIEQKVALPNGSVEIKKIPGNLRFLDITLKRGVDVDRALWDWRQAIVDGGFTQARSDGAIALLDATFQPLATFTFTNGWLSRYVFASPGADRTAIEEITLAVESWTRQ